MRSQSAIALFMSLILLALSGALMAGTPVSPRVSEVTPGPQITSQQSKTITGKQLTLTFLPAHPRASTVEINPPPELEPKQIARDDGPVFSATNDGPVVSGTVLGPSGGETTGAPFDFAPPASNYFKIYKNSVLTPMNSSRDNNEPSVANRGDEVFYTGNKYAARSTDGGSTWLYVKPDADFPNFCCDQDVIYDEGRNLLFWFRLGNISPSWESEFRIGVSRDGGKTFCYWDWRLTDFGMNIDLGWDFPQLALSDNFIYFTINAYKPTQTGGGYTSVLARAPLDSFMSCGTSTWTYWIQDRTPSGCYLNTKELVSPPVWTPVQGANTTMYLGQTTTDDCFTVWRQNESDSILQPYRIEIPRWTLSKTGPSGNSTNLTCPLPNGGGDPCQDLSHRVSAGWVARGKVGFFWSAAAGSGFPYPYVNAATFNERTLAYESRPYIWNRNHAWGWAAAYPNARGDLGIATWLMGGGLNPELYVGIDDQINGAPQAWEVKKVASSKTGSQSNNWGDYLRVRSHTPNNKAWIVSGHVSVQKGTNKGVSEPHYAIFGRAGDEGSIRSTLKQK